MATDVSADSLAAVEQAHERKRALAEGAYRKLLARLAAGGSLSALDIENTLAGVGKSPSDLRADLERHQQRLAQARLAAERPMLAEQIRDIEQQRAKVMAELHEVTQRLKRECAALSTTLDEVLAKHAGTQNAEGDLIADVGQAEFEALVAEASRE